MINRSKIIVFVAFLGTLFFMTMFAGGTNEAQRIVTRNVIFKDGITNEELSSEVVELGKSVRVPLVPEHDEFEFEGWYDEEGTRVTDFSEILADMTLFARYRDFTPIDDDTELLGEDPVITPPLRRAVTTAPITGGGIIVPEFSEPTPEPESTPDPIPTPDTPPPIILKLDIVDGEGNVLEDGQHVNPVFLPGEDVKLKITAPEGFQVSKNGVLITDITSDYSIADIPDGEYTFQLSKEDVTTEKNIVIDTTPPEVPTIREINNQPSNTWTNKDIVLIFETTDMLTPTDEIVYEKTLKAVGPKNVKTWGEIVSSPLIFEENPEVDNPIFIRAIDKAGNVSEPSLEGYRVKIDKLVPSIKRVDGYINEDKEDVYDFSSAISGNLRVFLRSSKPYSVPVPGFAVSSPQPSYEYKIEGTDEWIEFDSKTAGHLFAHTFNHDVRFRIIDTAGNISEETEIYRININKEILSIKLFDGVGNEINSGKHVNPDILPGNKLFLEINSISEYTLFKDGIEFTTGNSNSSIDLTNLEEGSYKFKVINNVSTESNEIVITIDKTKPTLKHFYEKDGHQSATWTNKDSLTIIYEFEDNYSSEIEMTYYLGTGCNRAGCTPWVKIDESFAIYDYTIQENVQIKAVDLAGNESLYNPKNIYFVQIDHGIPPKGTAVMYKNEGYDPHVSATNEILKFGIPTKHGIRIIPSRESGTTPSLGYPTYEYNIVSINGISKEENWRVIRDDDLYGISTGHVVIDEHITIQLQFRVKNQAGTAGAASDIYTVIIDRNNPVIEAFTIKDKIITSGSHINPKNLPEEMIVIKGNDENNFIIYQHYNGNLDLKSDVNQPFIMKAPKEGRYDFHAEDFAQNLSNKINLIIDYTAPDVPIIKNITRDKSTEGIKKIKLKFISNDNFTKPDQLKFQVSEERGNGKYEWIDVREEQEFGVKDYKRLVARAIDKAGNTSEISEVYSF